MNILGLEDSSSQTQPDFFNVSQVDFALGIAFIMTVSIIAILAYACRKVYERKKIAKAAMDKVTLKKDHVVSILNDEIDYINGVVEEGELSHIEEEDDIYSPKTMRETHAKISNFVYDNRISSPDFEQLEANYTGAYKNYINHCLTFNKAYLELMRDTNGFVDSIASIIIDKNDPIIDGVYSYTGKLAIDERDA